VEIRPERPEDNNAIARVVGDAFGGDVEVRLVEAIRASENYVPDFALVAVEGDDVIGHVMLSYVTLADDDVTHRILSLSPLAVAPDRQRVGVGSALVHEALAQADASGEPLVVLEGSPDYYGRLGF
jgi:putative acetyltransferase